MSCVVPEPRLCFNLTIETRMPTRLQIDPRVNHLLGAVNDADFERVAPLLEPVELPVGTRLFESGQRADYVYFPTTALVSLLHSRPNGAQAEIALVGKEGMVGLSLQTGEGGMPSVAVVHTAGIGFRVAAQALLREFNRGSEVIVVLLRYTQALVAQMALTNECSREHSLMQQLSRRLLLALDRLPPGRLLFTLPMAAELLGVREVNLDEATVELHNAKLIRIQLGHIEVLDRAGLERVSCNCYQMVTAEYQKVLPARIRATSLQT
jgi:CRP-like cAMP-binding protein